MMDLKTYKKELRNEKVSAREALSEEDRIRYSAEICGTIVSAHEYSDADTIFVYKWVRGEVRLDELEKAADSDGKRLVYPVCVSKTEMLAVEPGAGAWSDSGFKGIMEPALDKGTVIEPSEIDLIVVPCSSFDEQCRRLGMGGGYYDRYLPGCVNAKIIAVAYETQRAEEIPADEHDFPVDEVVTESRVIRR